MGTFNFTTRISKGEAQLRSMDLVEVIKSPSLVSGVENQVDLDAIMPTEIDDPYPVIILINGSGGCGKGTLIKQIRQYCNAPVYELSTVDPLRPVAKTLMEYQQDMFTGLFETDPMTASAEESEKGGPYRQFLSDLKYAWSNHNEGPNTYVVGLALKLITDNRWTIDEHTGLPIQPEPSPTTYDMPAMIFINAREPKNLDELKNSFWELGLLCFTMKMEGIEHKAEDLADSDLLVNDYDYDIVVRNKGTTDDLSVLAFTMNTFVNRANRMYGVSVAESKIDPRIAIGKEAMGIIHSEIDGKGYQGVSCVSSLTISAASAFDSFTLDRQLHIIEEEAKDAFFVAVANELYLREYSIVEGQIDPKVNVIARIDKTDPDHTITVLTIDRYVELAERLVMLFRFGFDDPMKSIIYTENPVPSSITPNKEEPAFSPTSFHPNAADRDGLWPENPELENTNNT